MVDIDGGDRDGKSGASNNQDFTRKPQPDVLAIIKKVRRDLAARGYSPVEIASWDNPPSPGKRPIRKRWQEESLLSDKPVLKRPVELNAINTGIAASGLRIVDVDIDDFDRAMRVHAVAVEILGEAPMRCREGSNRFALLYRAAEGRPPKRSIIGTTGEWVNDEFTADRIEVLGHGQQLVVHGWHKSGGAIRWLPTPPPRHELNAVTEEQIGEFLQRAGEIIEASDGGYDGAGWTLDAASDEPDKRPYSPALIPLAAPNVPLLVRLINAMANPKDTDRDRYVAAMTAIAGARAGMIARARERIADETAFIPAYLDEQIAHAAATWAAKWDHPNRASYEDERKKWLTDWARPKKFRLGWDYLRRIARKLGVADGIWAEILQGEAEAAFTAEPLPKGKTLDDMLPPRQLDRIDRFNEEYAVVKEGGKALIFEQIDDPLLNRRFFSRIKFNDFIQLYLNEQIQVGTNANGIPQYESAGKYWLTHRRRKQFLGGVMFDPSGRDHGPTVLNLWQGFALTPKAGSWALLQDHILKVVCGGDEAQALWFRRWMADVVQNPAKRGAVAVVMRGGEGCGKGTVARALLRLYGQHGLAVWHAKHLVGNFNAHLRDTIVLFADEAFYAGDKAHAGILKAIISEPDILIERKGIDAVRCPNFIHLIMATNNDWAVPASVDSRRLAVFDVADTHTKDRPYFNALWAELEAGGYQAMLHDLLTMDLTGFDVRDIPVTQALTTQRELSLKTHEAWWHECLLREYVYESRVGQHVHFHRWHEELSTEILYASYRAFAQCEREYRPLSRAHLGRFLNAKCGRPTKKTGFVIGESGGNGLITAEGQKPGYRFGPIDKARAHFIEKMNGLNLDWGDEDPKPDEIAGPDENKS